mmetsp:Transcript_28953/g.52445  ORF Transcript_28953/g.52445 Transcript_28953/m.52445 type:complete len:100 (+) Transcript_28953:123-422(+)
MFVPCQLQNIIRDPLMLQTSITPIPVQEFPPWLLWPHAKNNYFFSWSPSSAKKAFHSSTGSFIAQSHPILLMESKLTTWASSLVIPLPSEGQASSGKPP